MKKCHVGVHVETLTAEDVVIEAVISPKLLVLMLNWFLTGLIDLTVTPVSTPLL